MRRNGFSQRDVDRQWNQIVNMIRKKQISGVVVCEYGSYISSVADAYFKVGLVIEAGGIVVTVDEGRLDMHITKGSIDMSRRTEKESMVNIINLMSCMQILGKTTWHSGRNQTRNNYFM